jgi:multicomponent Na+:H+ antiporter subunit G
VSLLDWAALPLLVGGSAFFLAGTAGVLRFPDLYSRLHAVTKADNLGLGLVAAGLALQSGSIAVALKLLAIWLLALAASAGASYLIASDAYARRDPPAEGGDRA